MNGRAEWPANSHIVPYTDNGRKQRLWNRQLMVDIRRFCPADIGARDCLDLIVARAGPDGGHDHLFCCASHVSTRNVAITPERLTASSACRGSGFRRFLPLPWASLNLLRSDPRFSTTVWQPPKMRLKLSSACWLGARLSNSPTSGWCVIRRLGPWAARLPPLLPSIRGRLLADYRRLGGPAWQANIVDRHYGSLTDQLDRLPKQRVGIPGQTRLRLPKR